MKSVIFNVVLPGLAGVATTCMLLWVINLASNFHGW